MPEYRFQWVDEVVVVVVEPVETGFAVTIDGITTLVTAASHRPGQLDLSWEDSRRLVTMIAAVGAHRWLALTSGPQAGRAFELTVPQSASRRPRPRQTDGRETLTAQMPGIVRRVLVHIGDQAARGQTLIILEAMKIEIRINAPGAGTVTAVSVTEGQTVERGQLLVEFSASPPSPL